MSDRTVGLILLAIAEVAAVFAVAHVDLEAVRVPCGVITVGLAPGWLLLQRTNYAGSQLEQFALGALLSLGIALLATLALLLTPVGITAASTSVTLGGIVALLALPPWRFEGWVGLSTGAVIATSMIGVVVLTAGAVAALVIAPRSPRAADGPEALGLRVEQAADGARRVHIDVLGNANARLDLVLRTTGAPRRMTLPPRRPRAWSAVFVQDRRQARERLTVTLLRNGRPLRTATLRPALATP